MENIALNDSGPIYRDAADRQFLCADLALYLCPFGDHDGRGAYLALDVTKNSEGAIPIILPTIEMPEPIEEAASDCNALPSRDNADPRT